MKKRVLITSIFSGNTLKHIVARYSPNKIILVVEKGLETAKDRDSETKKEAIKEFKNFFKGILEIDVLKVESLYNLYKIVEEVINEIDKEFKEDSTIFMHVSEGRKPLAFGLSFAAYMRRNKVKGIYYVIKERDNEILELPLLRFPEINESQKSILLKIKKGVNINNLINKGDKSRSVLYQYVKKLQDDGYLTSENKHLELTDLGRIMIL